MRLMQIILQRQLLLAAPIAIIACYRLCRLSTCTTAG
jgi:hypothetical protein